MAKDPPSWGIPTPELVSTIGDGRWRESVHNSLFPAHVSVSDVGSSTLTLQVLRDDGVVVYLNARKSFGIMSPVSNGDTPSQGTFYPLTFITFPLEPEMLETV